MEYSEILERVSAVNKTLTDKGLDIEQINEFWESCIAKAKRGEIYFCQNCHEHQSKHAFVRDFKAGERKDWLYCDACWESGAVTSVPTTNNDQRTTVTPSGVEGQKPIT